MGIAHVLAPAPALPPACSVPDFELAPPPRGRLPFPAAGGSAEKRTHRASVPGAGEARPRSPRKRKAAGGDRDRCFAGEREGGAPEATVVWGGVPSPPSAADRFPLPGLAEPGRCPAGVAL